MNQFLRRAKIGVKTASGVRLKPLLHERAAIGESTPFAYTHGPLESGETSDGTAPTIQTEAELEEVMSRPSPL